MGTDVSNLLTNAGHRSCPPKITAWIMRQTWSQLLFAQWPAAADDIQRLLPKGLQLDLYQGQVWLAVVPFQMSGVTLRHVPEMPGLSRFLDLNVRTYVCHGERPGVYFLSLEASNPIAVEVARAWYHLPYFHAHMSLGMNDGSVTYSSERTDRRGLPAAFRASYAPLPAVQHAEPGSLESFLTDRYCLYTACGGNLMRGEIHHGPWPLQRAQADIAVNTMLNGLPVRLLAEQPLLHYVQSLDTIEWPLERLE